MKTTVYLAELETGNFSFRAIGTTERNAYDALIRGLVRHARETLIAKKWYEDFLDGINITSDDDRQSVPGPL